MWVDYEGGRGGLEILWGCSGGCRKHNFWTALVKSIKIYIFGILASRAINWYIYGSNRRKGVRGGADSFRTPPPNFYWATPTKF